MNEKKLTKDLVASVTTLTKAEWEALKTIVDDLFEIQINKTKIDENLLSEEIKKYKFYLENGEVLKNGNELKTKTAR